MSSKAQLKLKKGESIVTAYAEYVAGPGWSNTPIWVIIRRTDGKLRDECIQPEEQTPTMRVLFRVSNAAHVAMVAAVAGEMK